MHRTAAAVYVPETRRGCRDSAAAFFHNKENNSHEIWNPYTG